jgi:hypothetical protein
MGPQVLKRSRIEPADLVTALDTAVRTIGHNVEGFPSDISRLPMLERSGYEFRSNTDGSTLFSPMQALRNLDHSRRCGKTNSKTVLLLASDDAT